MAYVALTDKTYRFDDIVFDEQYQDVKAAKAKKELIKSEWLDAFKTLNEAKKRPIDNISGASTPGTPAKKPRLVNIGENFKAFLNSGELSSKILERMAKDRIGQDREVTVCTDESPNSMEAYVTKTRKKKKTGVKLALHYNGVSKHLKNQMANLTEQAFRHTLTTWASCESRGQLATRRQQRRHCWMAAA